MYNRRLFLDRWFPCWLFGLLVLTVPLLLSGCQNDDITTYQAPKSEPLVSAAVKFRQRLIAVAIPQDKQMWVVILIGPEKQVGPFVDQFDELIQSVELSKQAGKPIAWKLPQGWSQLPDEKIAFRYAAFKIATDDAIEIKVSRVDNSPKLDNINRWRNQIGLGPISKEQVDLYAKPQKVKSDDEAWRVDMIGSLMAPIAKKHAAPMFQDEELKPPKYEIPEGWKEVPAAKLSLVTFAIQQGDDQAQVTLTPLGAVRHGVAKRESLAAEQLGLPAIDEEQLKKEVKADKVGGAEAQYVKLVGEKNAILGFIVKRGKHTWYLKMIGTKGLVEKQEAVFVAFCRSLEF